MNSSFTNSNFGRILYIAIITLIVAATAFVIWYMTAGYKLGTYEPDTRLGSVYIGGLTEEEVTPKLDTKINNWYGDPTIVFELRYQGYSYSFDRNLFYFNLENSIDQIEQGQINEIQVFYQGDDIDGVKQEIENLEFLDGIIDNVDVTQLISDILTDASFMKSYSIKNVEDYLISPDASYETLDTSNLIIPDGFDVNALYDKVLEKYPNGKIEIHPEELFDVITLFGDTMNDVQMSVLSSAMLDLILETNFIINEVHAKPIIEFDKYTIDNYPYFARNANVYEVTNESFSFYNPNTSMYYFVFNNEDNTLELEGLPFEYIITVTSIEDAKTILPYTFEQSSNVDRYQEGHEGAMIIIERMIKDLDNVVVSNKVILNEFYPPEKKIDLFE